MADLASGIILIADPFLKDPNFLRTTVFICEHNTEGSVGFVINRKHDVTLGELLPDELADCSFPVFYGGPVQQNSIHFLHHRPDLIMDGAEITDGIFWGGNFEQVTALLQNKQVEEGDIRFFLGYSGWSEGQLEDELKEKSWLITEGRQHLVFHPNEGLIWQDALKQLGGQYEQLIHYPIDPQLN